MDHVIFHTDVNSAFLSWSAVKRLSEDPTATDLRLIPSAVGGDVKTRHGVITAKSIPAKKYGIRTGEAVMTALGKCPDLVLVPSDFTTYRKYSRAFIEILRKHANVVEQVSIDEAFLDMTGLEGAFPDEPDLPFPLNAAKLIRDEIRETLGFTVNVGISSNKLLAKMASDFEKPDRTHTLWPDEVPSKMWPLPIGELFGCGSATASRLNSLGIKTIGDAAQMDVSVLMAALGERSGAYIHRAANGIGNAVVSDEAEDAKSYSNETTTSEDITEQNYREKGVPIIRKLSERVAQRMQRDGVRAHTLGILVKTGEFRRLSRQTTVDRSTNSADDLFETALSLMDQLLLSDGGLFQSGQVLRLIGVSAQNLVTGGGYEQVSLFDWAEDARKEAEAREAARAREEQERLKRERELARMEEERLRKEKAARKAERLDKMMKTIRDRYGDDAVRRGGASSEGASPPENGAPHSSENESTSS